MNNSAKPASQPIVIVSGVSAIGKPKAGKFKGTEVPAARKAAAKLGLTVIDVTDEAGLALVAKLPAGRIGGSGETIIPFVNKDLHTQIKALEGQSQKNGQAETGAAAAVAPPTQGPRLPRSWDDIKAGDLVLAQDSDPTDGWWQCRVIEAADDIFKLRWPRSERGRPFQRHRHTLGLINPGEIKDEPKPEPKKGSAEPSSVYPVQWSVIGLNQIVLAPEEGPMGQFWESKTISLDKDLFTLQWRDHTNLPVIVRPRSALGLVHPAPKIR